MDGAGQELLEQRIREQLDARQLEEAAQIALTGYGPEILAYLARAMGREEDASEVYAQFCEDLWRGLQGFSGGSSFRTWAYHLARNARNRFWKEPFRRLGRPLESGEVSRIQALARSTTLVYRKTEIKDSLAEIRQELSPEERELLILRVDRRMSWNEIAGILAEGEGLAGEELRTSAAALRQRFKRLHTKLRKLFQERGLLSEDPGALRS